MGITPPAVVQGAARPQLPYGLFSVLAPREASTDRWEGGGVTFESLGCAPAPGAGQIGTFACEATEGLPKSFAPNAAWSDAETFTVYQSEKCSPIGEGLERSNRIAEGRLAIFEEMLVERKLWAKISGLESGANIATGSNVDITATSLAAAVANIERAQGAIHGTQGVLHMSRGLAVIGITAKLLETRSNRLTTRLGTPVVAGAGYGTAEQQVTERVVWTPQMFGYRSPVITSSNRLGDLLDRNSNDLFAVAERSWLIGFDECDGWDVAFTTPFEI